MNQSPDSQPSGPPPRRYRWPWFLLAAVLLGIVLAVLWMSKEAQRTRQLRQWNEPAPTTGTNQSSP